MFIFPFLGTWETCFERVKRVKDPLDIFAHKNNLFLQVSDQSSGNNLDGQSGAPSTSNS